MATKSKKPITPLVTFDADREEKRKALKTAMKQIEKDFGEGAIMKLGANPRMAVQAVHTGSLSLDMALGIGGVPRGRIIEIFGPESSGKTTVALHIAAEVQKAGGEAAFIDAEHALDPVYAKALGVDIDNLLVSQPDCGEDALSICESLVRSGAVDVVVVDSAHGHTKGIMNMTTWITKHFPNVDVIAGNIATGEAAVALAKAGAHAVKVGIGPGSICTTRVVCGVGIPQLTAVYNAAKALRGSGVPVIADGGIKLSGDVPKALVAGASSVMLGSVLAGTDESPGEKIYANGRRYVAYRGMGSMAALKNGKGSRARYFQDNEEDDALVPQGIEGMVPYSGHVHSIMTQFCGGLRASLGYCGTKTVAELQANGKFYRVTAAGQREARPHDITITKEAPNYRA